jgi:uncharacterized membrane protein YhaH (DUF805 family)
MIGPVEAVRNAFQQYASARGRASRAEYWWWVLFNAAIQLLLGDGPLAALAVLALIVPSIAVLVRRLHDLDRSAWSLLVALIPAVGLVILVVALALPGTSGSNRYGPPRAPAAPPSEPWRPGGPAGPGGPGGQAGPGGPGGQAGPGGPGGWDSPPPPPAGR